MSIQLDFVNRSQALGRPDIVFFQKNVFENETEVVAWKVIRGCTVDWRHPFPVPLYLELGLADAHGNHSPTIQVEGGHCYELVCRHPRPQWNTVRIDDPARIEVRNGLRELAVGLRLTRDRRLIAPVRWLSPGALIGIRDELQLWVGAVLRAREGEFLGPFERKIASTSLDLAGFSRAEVWMLGGGVGASAKPLRFYLMPLDRTGA